MKRTFSIILVVIVVVLIAFAIFYFFFRHPQQAASPSNSPSGSLPQVGSQSITASSTPFFNTGAGANASGTASSSVTFGVVSNEPVLNYFADSAGNITAVEPDGKVAAITNGQVAYLSSSEVQNLIGASFSSDGKKIVMSFGDPSDPQASIFNVGTDTWISLTAGASSPTWAPSGYQLAYLQSNSNGTESIMMLTAATSTVSKPVAVATLHIQDMTLSWINKNEIVLSDKPSDYAPGSIVIFDLTNKSLTPAVLETEGVEATWSNTASPLGLVLSGSASGGGTLTLLNPETGNDQAISFLTLPTKCAFNQANASSVLMLYCGVPRDSATLGASKVPDDYNQMALFTSDDFYSINTLTGAISEIFSPAGDFDSTDVKIFNNDLFFVNRYDQKLYALSLTAATSTGQ